MKKILKITLKTFATIALFLFVLPIFISLILQINAVQNYIVHAFSKFATEKLGSEVSIRSVDLKLFYRAEVQGFFVQDPVEKDTLMYVDKLSARLASLNVFGNNIKIADVKIDSGKVYLNTDSDKVVNIKRIVDKLKDPNKKPNPIPFKLSINDIKLKNIAFEYRAFDDTVDVKFGVNFKNMRFNNINTHIRDFAVIRDTILMKVDSLNFVERCGLPMKNITVRQLTLSPSTIRADGTDIAVGAATMKLKYFALGYQEWTMSDFVQKVRMSADVESSSVDMATIAYFTRKERPWSTVFVFSGDVDGTVSNMFGTVRYLATGNSTRVRNVKYLLRGLPDIDDTYFKFEIPGLNTSLRDIGDIMTGFTGKLNALSSERIFTPDMIIECNAEGRMSDLHTDVKVRSGNSRMSLVGALKSVNGVTNTNIRLKIPDFNVKEIFGIKNIESVALTADIKATFGKRRAAFIDTEAHISYAELFGYRYKDMNIDGLIDGYTFKGNINSNDPNADFKFDGMMNVMEKEPSYDFSLLVNNANLSALNIDKRDSVSLLKLKMFARGKGTTIDNLDGNIEIDELKYLNSSDTINTGNISIVTRNSDSSKFLRLTSDFADIEMQGKQSYSNILTYLRYTVQQYLPSLQQSSLDLIKSTVTGKKSSYKDETEEKEDVNALELGVDDYYIVTLNVKKANNVASIFMPGLEVAEGTKFAFMLNPRRNNFSFTLDSKYILGGEQFLLRGINVNSRSVADSISFFARADQFIVGRLNFPSLSVVGGIKNNSIILTTGFSNPTDKSSAFIATRTEIGRNEAGAPQLNVELFPSNFSLANMRWQTNSSRIVIDSSRVQVSGFKLSLADQVLKIDGGISQSHSDTLNVALQNFNIEPLGAFVSDMGYKITGRLNGRIQYVSELGGGYFLAGVRFTEAMINDHLYPDATFMSKWSSSEKKLSLRMTNELGEQLVDGYMFPKTGKYYADIKMDSVDLGFVAPFLKGISSQTVGVANVKMSLSNPKNYFSINGTVEIPRFATTINYTGCRYTVSGVVDVKDNQFHLRNGRIVDQLGHNAPFTAEATHKKFRNINYRIGTTINNMLCLNTTANDNGLFYGRVFATGTMNIVGHGRDVTMGISATTNNNSTFAMPLSNKATMTEADFITFVKPKEKEEEEKKYGFLIPQKREERERQASLFKLNLNINVQPNLEAQIVIDPTVGNVIKARGVGQFNINVVPARSQFSISGGYSITEGSYLFTLSNIINKYFTIAPGSSISWTGDPLAANLNVTAIYKVKTSLAPLLGSYYNKRVDVDCNLTLQGNLLKPDIKLGITVPGAEPETQGLIASALNTEESVSLQLFWLLFSNTFFADSNSTSGSNVNVGIATGAAVTGLEFLSNQISNWLSTDKFNLGISYRPKSELASDELELRFSTPLFSNRLLLDAEGNYDFNNNKAYATENFRNISGNFSLTYMLNKADNLKFKVFTRQITTFDENQGLQENGVGIYYTDDFNKFGDIIRKYAQRRKELKIERIKRRNLKDSIGVELYRQQKKEARKKEREESEKQ